ncbi:DMT family transporter [Chthonobacter rhizosphaerae]|uniref:DMT family transporter n=1 Tax=Chthonobacter rhizosphaerae TaxID=2735553 RepID=UPI0015EF6A26|nr:DMT family transporter [Chthonobacter rhizosphaerae]
MTAMAPTDAAAARPQLAPFTLFDFALYAITVFAWSTSWIALKMQVGTVAPEVSVAWRFILSAMIMIGWVAAAGQKFRFPLKDHARFAIQGALLFSTNFYLFYLGGQVLASGLLSVVFSLASVVNLVMAAVVFRQGIVPRVALGALIGFVGIGLVFWPEIAGAEFDHAAAVGLGFCIAGTVSFCTGNMISGANQARGLPVVSTNAWGMVYGAGVMVALALVNGRTFEIEWTTAYIGSLFWLSIVSSVIAFASYLTLLGRIGAARAGYATVIFPVFALGISTVFEGYVWTPVAIAGLMAVIVGNLVVLSRGKR